MAIFTSSDFRYDWYGFLTNQFSHISMGIYFVWAAAVLSFFAVGSMPFKLPLFFFISGAYFLYEVTFQGWRRWDTIEDTLFITYGQGGTLLAFTEIVVGSPVIGFSILKALPILTISTLHLLIGSYIRYRRKDDDNS